jgi:hypothetical protein
VRNVECLTKTRKRLILLAFVSYEAVRLWWWGGSNGVVVFGKSPKTCSIPTLASISTRLRTKELSRLEWPLSVKLSVNRRAFHNSPELFSPR